MNTTKNTTFIFSLFAINGEWSRCMIMEKVLNELCAGLELELGVPVRLDRTNFDGGPDGFGGVFSNLTLVVDGKGVFTVSHMGDLSDDELSGSLLSSLFRHGYRSFVALSRDLNDF